MLMVDLVKETAEARVGQTSRIDGDQDRDDDKVEKDLDNASGDLK